MAATYGYNGEFSSDEDIDRMEQQAERVIQSKFDGYTQIRPTKRQVEEAIETIRNLPLEQDVSLTDELLAGLLDHYKTQRGPIVDSTRNLYKKIILRLVRAEQIQQNVNNGDSNNSSNSESNGNNNIVINNNNNNNNNNINDDINPISKVPLDLGSSDEDEPMPPVSSQSSVEQDNKKKKFDSRVIQQTPMDVDLDTQHSRPPPAYRTSHPRPVDLTTDSSESDSETGDCSDESTDSELLDVTPIKVPTHIIYPLKAVAPVVATVPVAQPVSEKTPESTKKLGASAAPKSTTSSASSDSKKKPYTRSQRIAANRMSSTPAKETSSAGVKPLTKSALTSYENCSRSLSKVKLEQQVTKNIVENENGEIVHGSTINGRKLNYAEKMVLSAMMVKHRQRLKTRKSC